MTFSNYVLTTALAVSATSLATALPTNAFASDDSEESQLKYTYVDITYEKGDLELDNFPEESFDLIGLSGSYLFNETFFSRAGFFTGGADYSDYSINNIDIGELDVSAIFLGVGARFDISKYQETFAQITLEAVHTETQLDSINLDESDTTELLGFGIRHLTASNYEIFGGTNIEDGDFLFYLGGVTRFNSSINIGLTLNKGEDTQSYLLFLRYTPQG